MSIATDVSSAFQAGSGIGTDDIQIVVTSLSVVLILIFAAWYLMKTFARGWHKADLPHIVTGLVLVLILVFFVLWLTAQDW